MAQWVKNPPTTQCSVFSHPEPPQGALYTLTAVWWLLAGKSSLFPSWIYRFFQCHKALTIFYTPYSKLYFAYQKKKTIFFTVGFFFFFCGLCISKLYKYHLLGKACGWDFFQSLVRSHRKQMAYSNCVIFRELNKETPWEDESKV